MPLAALISNFSSMPFSAPPPLGRDIWGISMALDSVACSRVREERLLLSREASGLGVFSFVLMIGVYN